MINPRAYFDGSVAINIAQIAYVSDDKDNGTATVFVVGRDAGFQTNRPLKDIV